MKLPIPFLLYVVALGLFGLAGWTVYQTLPLWKKEVREGAHIKGVKDGTDLIGKGRGQGAAVTSWRYDAAPWWAGLKTVNLTGKLPPPPPKPDDEEKIKAAEVIVDARPLSELFELVSLVYDGETGGKGGNSQVIIRFKQEANVEVPEWKLREQTAPAAASQPTAPGPRDGVPPNRGGKPAPAPPPRPQAPPRGTTVMPVAGSGREVLQVAWVKDDGDPKRTAEIWPMKPANLDPSKGVAVLGTIRLVRIAPDAQSAFFSREVPSTEPGKPPTTREDELFKAEMNLSQEMLAELRRLQGQDATPRGPATAPAPTAAQPWVEVEETTMVGKVRHIGRKDQKRLSDSEDWMEQINVDTYVSSKGRRGLIVRSVDSKLAASFGVAAGDVLIEVNGQKVESKAQAMSVGKAQYKRGVRTFVTKWLSNGQEVERTYQAPDK
jgi:hypothetical protein